MPSPKKPTPEPDHEDCEALRRRIAALEEEVRQLVRKDEHHFCPVCRQGPSMCICF